MGSVVFFTKHVLSICCVPGPGKMAGTMDVKRVPKSLLSWSAHVSRTNNDYKVKFQVRQRATKRTSCWDAGVRKLEEVRTDYMATWGKSFPDQREQEVQRF